MRLSALKINVENKLYLFKQIVIRARIRVYVIDWYDYKTDSAGAYIEPSVKKKKKTITPLITRSVRLFTGTFLQTRYRYTCASVRIPLYLCTLIALRYNECVYKPRNHRQFSVKFHVKEYCATIFTACVSVNVIPTRVPCFFHPAYRRSTTSLQS